MAVYSLFRPWMFRLDPERAHALVMAALRLTGGIPPLRAAARAAFGRTAGAPVVVSGLHFPNAVGLAAGYDKDGLAWRGLACLGFGHLELGTVTPRPQPGNPQPRLFRLVEERSLINRLGFPSRGAEHLERRLAGRGGGGPVLGVNIGKQKDTPLERAAEDYEALIARFAPLVDYLAVNISSPNTPELRRLQERDRLEPLLARLVARRDATARQEGRRVPLWVKLSPDMSPETLEPSVGAIRDAGIDGIIATNTTLDRSGVRSARAGEAGGLSGAALTSRSTEVLRQIGRHCGGSVALVGCGGILDERDALDKIEAGASLVQLWSGLVYEGPGLVGRVVRALAGARSEVTPALR